MKDGYGKMRVCAYLPVSEVTKKDGVISEELPDNICDYILNTSDQSKPEAEFLKYDLFKIIPVIVPDSKK